MTARRAFLVPAENQGGIALARYGGIVGFRAR
jgi:hypothetical protein